jgi:4-amino-4-deoxy-L-arabinose transferase-like glycosyltransferase
MDHLVVGARRAHLRASLASRYRLTGGAWARRALAAPGAFRAAVVLISAAAIVRLVLAASFPLVPDETYYWEWSRRLAGGYFDHPPAIALLVRGGVTLFGVTPLGVRAGAVLAGWLATLCLVLITRRLAGDSAALRAAAVVTCMPLAAAGLVLATPDAPLLFTVAATLLALDHAVSERPGTGRALVWWSVSGIALGAALASKYTAVLVPAAVGVALLASRPLRRQLATPGPYLAVLLSLVVFAPVLLWNAQHDWVSFRFQLDHGLGAATGTPARQVASLVGGQLGVVSPILFVLLAVAVGRGLRSRAPRAFLLAVVAAGIFLFFCVTALKRPVEPDWQAPAYVPAIALLAVEAARRRLGRWLVAACGLGGALVVIIYVQAVAPFLPIAAASDPTARGAGWHALARRAHEVAATLETPADGRTWFGGDRYQAASEIAFHLPTHPPTFSLNLTNRPNQYDLWPGFPERAHPGDNLVLALGMAPDRAITMLAPHFRRVWLADTVELRRGREVRTRRLLWVLEGWRGSWPEASLP